MQSKTTFKLIESIITREQKKECERLINRDGFQFQSLFRDGSVELIRGNSEIKYIERNGSVNSK